MPITDSPYFQPGFMFVASCINIGGAVTAVAIGEAQKNPFFFTSLLTSFMYAWANGVRVKQIYNERNSEPAKTFAESITLRREVSSHELSEIVVRR